MSKATKLEEAQSILADLGLPKAQQNERTAYCLLALLSLRPDKAWKQAKSPLIGITPMMDWVRDQYGKHWKPNTRETVRRQSVHQLVQAGIAICNPDKPSRPINSPLTVYQIAAEVLKVICAFGKPTYKALLNEYLGVHQTFGRHVCQGA